MAVRINKMVMTIILATALVMALGYIFIINATDNGHEAVVAPAVKEQKADQPVAQKNDVKKKVSPYPDAPNFSLKDLENNDVQLSDYKGKVVFVNFWATWCGPCRAEIPYFIDLVNKYDKDGFVVLGIALDPREFTKVPDFVKKIGINYPVLFDQSGVSEVYGGIQSIPTTFVVNRDGKVVEMIIGSRPKEVFESIIQSNL